MSANINKNVDPLQLVTLKPGEPSFMPKNKVQFSIPPELLEERFRDVAKDMEADLDNEVEKIPVKNITPPNIDKAVGLSKTDAFSVFSPIHKQYVHELVKVFLAAKDKEELLAIALYARDQVNPQLFFYAYSLALSHRSDTADMELPSLLESDPDKFISNSILFDARQEAFVVPPKLRRPIEIPVQYTSTDLNPEQRLAYFREDIGVNFHHFHWHIVYPTEGPAEIVSKDRRGELFFYMHSQVLARYNLERLCNKLKVVEPLNFTKAPIKHGYFPKLSSASASRTVIGRQDDVILPDMERTARSAPVRVADIEVYANRIKDGILQGFLINAQGQKVSINNDRGADILGNVVEGSSISINPLYYGDLHNTGHIIISQIHDPDNEFMEQPGIMGSTNTAMRDPVFYEWHTFIDTFYKQHKRVLAPYTDNELSFKNVHVRSIEILDKKDTSTKQLRTFWQKSEVNLSSGLDYVNSGAIRVRFQHLNHEEFKYRIIVENKGMQRFGTVRIFLLPVQDLSYTKYSLDEGRLLAIELDRFVVKLPSGTSQIIRPSNQSTVTIPFESIFPPVVVDQNGNDLSFSRRSIRQVHCRCGWPEYLLIPKGTAAGFKCNIFVMVSDNEQDKVLDDPKSNCSVSTVFCGLKNSVYPDRRPMGYPFDKVTNKETLSDFLKSNMAINEISIKHINEVKKEYKAELVNVKTGKNVRVGI